MKPVTLLVIGAGSRGTGYAHLASQMPGVRVVGVAEPRSFWRESLAREHAIPAAQVFTDWRQAAACEPFADAALICTQDRLHTEPALALIEKGYHVVLEKPMAPTMEECERIVEAALRRGTILAVPHVLRYTLYTRQLMEAMRKGAIGEVVSLQHLEPVGYWHFAHSYVRGEWRREALSSPALLAKSCHDLDWMRAVVGRPCLSVASFGSLMHFRPEMKPAGAGTRCLACDVEPECPYSAKRFYLSRVRAGQTDWPVNVITHDRTEAGVTEALRTGPYGRCVYACDNDAVDQQVVIANFEGGATATFTMIAFVSEIPGRMTRIFGTHGWIEGDSEKIEVYNFLSGKKKVIDSKAKGLSINDGHGGGDGQFLKAFIEAVREQDPSRVLTGPEETLASHRMVFAAERARHEGRVVALAEMETPVVVDAPKP